MARARAPAPLPPLVQGGHGLSAGPEGALPFGAAHHAAIICRDYGRSRRFYVELLALPVIAETWRAERRSWKLDLAVGPSFRLELFSFPDAPERPDAPEAAGLRHLAFSVPDVSAAAAELDARGVPVEPIREDPLTGKRYTFFKDPDGLPLELYEA